MNLQLKCKLRPIKLHNNVLAVLENSKIRDVKRKNVTSCNHGKGAISGLQLGANALIDGQLNTISVTMATTCNHMYP